MIVTITGANGFIGKRMIELLSLRSDCEINAVVRQGSKNTDYFNQYSNVRVIECDMENYSQLGSLSGGGDVFINYTWDGSRGASRMDSQLQKLNYECSVNAAISMVNSGYKVIVSSGSQAEYGQIDGIITEETNPIPNTEYGKYKLLVFEKLTEIAHRYNIKFIEPRYFSLYGPGDYENTLIMLCISKMLKNQDVVLNPCTQFWDYLYVDDACNALLRLIENNVPSGVYNFASGSYRQLKDYVLDIKKALKSSSNVLFDNPSNYNGIIINLRPKIDKLLMATSGWKPSTSFVEGINQINKL